MPVETGPQVDVASAWRRSSFCADSACVEVSVGSHDIAVRDAKRSDSPVLSFTREEWTAFIQGVKTGEFDLVDSTRTSMTV